MCRRVKEEHRKLEREVMVAAANTSAWTTRARTTREELFVYQLNMLGDDALIKRFGMTVGAAAAPSEIKIYRNHCSSEVSCHTQASANLPRPR